MSVPSEVHMRLKLKGDPTKLEMFHALLGNFDVDWPYTNYTMKTCSKCGGVIYSRPRWHPNDIKVLSKQLGAKVKILNYTLAEKCKGASYTPSRGLAYGCNIPGYAQFAAKLTAAATKHTTEATPTATQPEVKVPVVNLPYVENIAGTTYRTLAGQRSMWVAGRGWLPVTEGHGRTHGDIN